MSRCVSDLHADHAVRVRRDAEARARQDAERRRVEGEARVAAERAWQDERLWLIDDILRTGSRSSMQRFVDRIVCERHQITRLELPGRYASAFPSRREILGSPITDEETFAAALHEAGHVIAGPCRGAAHYIDRTRTDAHHCLKCEHMAWERAMRLFPFTRGMLAHMEHCISTYLRVTPAPAAVRREVERMRSSEACAATLAAQARYRLAVAKQQRVALECHLDELRAGAQRARDSANFNARLAARCGGR